MRSIPTITALTALTALSFVLVSGLEAQANKSPSPDLSDPEVAHVAVTANTIDIDLAKFAEKRSRDGRIRGFAASMIADHSGVNAQATALAGKLGVTPADNAVSQSLLEGARDARASIEGLRGTAFDRAYIEREVAYHQAVLDALDQLLVPTTENAELKKLLTDVRPAIAAHLAHATMVRDRLAEGAGK